MEGPDRQAGWSVRLGLCSGALPDASLDDLVEAVVRRGLAVLELRAGDAHGVDTDRPLFAAAALDRVRIRGAALSAFRDRGAGSALRLARVAELLDVPILVGGPAGLSSRIARATRVAGHGACVAVVVRGAGAVPAAREVAGRGIDVAWDVDPSDEAPHRTVADLLDAVGRHLRHIRLHGGGPESALQEGRGIGGMAGRLALAGYDGPVVLTPASTAHRIAWQAWLGRRGGWGCGGAARSGELVNLTTPDT